MLSHCFAPLLAWIKFYKRDFSSYLLVSLKMGARKSQPLSEYEFSTIAKNTGVDIFTVKGLYTEFTKNSKRGLMNKKQFRQLYSTLTPGEDPESSFKLRRIANRVFKAFDRDKSGKLSFDEFVAAYHMLNTQGKAREKMEFLLSQIGPRAREASSHPVAVASSDQPITHQEAEAILTGMDEAFDVKRAPQTLEALKAKQDASGAVTPKAFVDAVVSDPTYVHALENLTADAVANNPENDVSEIDV